MNEDDSRDGGGSFYKSRNADDWAEARNGLPSEALTRNQPCQHSALTVPASRTMRRSVSVVPATQFGELGFGSPRRLTHTSTCTSLVGPGTWLSFLESNPATHSQLFTLPDPVFASGNNPKVLGFFKNYFVAYYPAVKRNKSLIRVTSRMSLQGITWGEKSQS